MWNVNGPFIFTNSTAWFVFLNSLNDVGSLCKACNAHIIMCDCFVCARFIDVGWSATVFWACSIVLLFCELLMCERLQCSPGWQSIGGPKFYSLAPEQVMLGGLSWTLVFEITCFGCCKLAFWGPPAIIRLTVHCWLLVPALVWLAGALAQTNLW